MPTSPYIRSIREKIGHAPQLLPSVTAVIFDSADRVLLQRSRDDGKWHTIGGMIEQGEQPAAAVIREVKEETDLEVMPERVSGVYAWPESRYANGDVCCYTAIAFRCRIVGGALRVADDESIEFEYFDLVSLPPLLAIEKNVIHDALSNQDRAAFCY